MLILICGLPGTGKSFLAEKLTVSLGAVHLSTDIIRKRAIEKRTYSEREKEAVYKIIFSEAEKEIKNKKNVILDGTFYRNELRKRAVETATRNNERCIIVECTLAENILRERMEKRAKEGSESEADFAVYEKVKRQFEPIKETHIVIDTSVPPKKQVEKVEEYAMVEQLKNSAKDMKITETHISRIFLTGDIAYKIKKPVKFSFLDFSTLAKRKKYCEEEVRLNRRLSPEIYLGVIPIIKTKEFGRFVFEGEKDGGAIVEYAVKMKRLTQERKMDNLLKAGKISEKEIKSITEIIADFHSRIKTIKNKKYGSAKSVKKQVDDLAGVRETIESACGMGKEVDFVLEKSDSFIKKNHSLFAKRQKNGKIRECHGDLHSANIFIMEYGKIFIFDCIEFNKDFRYIDTASEVAFMAMDLDAFGRKDLSELFVKEYVRLTQDAELLDLLDLYKCYRANVRAKVAALAIMHGGGEGSRENIIKYLKLAGEYARGL